MGSQVFAICQCGVEGAFSIGGGMSNFMKVCYFPCLCVNCCAIVEVNLLDKPLQCPECGNSVVPYDSRKLMGSKGQNVVADWNVREQLGRNLKLTDGTYKCPQCGEMSLQFSVGGIHWD
ncbi:MAG: hypothetical protein HN368_00265 [Spirochaetales bacterium]|nr:hypothetical protein [Spirochaetales bacterium]